MLTTNIFLTFFLTNLLTAGILLLLTTNPIHSLLFLILIFVNSAGILMIFNFEFIALLLIVIYVGALAVLFLFILMMIDIVSSSSFQTDWFVFLIFSSLLSLSLFIETFESTFEFLVISVHELTLGLDLWVNIITEINNCATFGQVLYNYYYFFFLLAGLILLLALLGAVRLTHSPTKVIDTQHFAQLSKTFYISFVK
jgi:NADH-quinone oxidoreductase subunit J